MKNKVYPVVIIGAGAAGLICAVRLGENGIRALLLEGQDHPARKLLITGGGRCNITNRVVKEGDYASGCPRAVRHVLQTFSSQEAVTFFEQKGVPLVLEDDGKYFTADGRASQVVEALVQAAKAAGARIFCGQRVEQVGKIDGIFVIRTEMQEFRAQQVVVATGGLSYPQTGSSGAGFQIAKSFGHALVPTAPALVPLVTKDKSYSALAGLTLPAGLSLWAGGRKIGGREGSFLFTHMGFSGPVVMDMSRDWQQAPQDRTLVADFSPRFSAERVEQCLMDDRSRLGLIARLGEFIPRRLAGFLVARAGVDAEVPASLLKRGERKKILGLVKEHDLPVSSTAGFHKAEVTCGGVDLRELQGASLESRLQPGLFFAGEVLDVDGRVGGFNLQWAWASGVAAAQGILRRRV